MDTAAVDRFSEWFKGLPPDAQAAAAARFKEATGGRLSPYCNPTPVAVALVPVYTDHGIRLLGLRRAIEPRLGTVVLPGGFMEEGEEPEQTAAREVREETGLETAPEHYAPDGRARAAGRGTLLMFYRHTVPITHPQFLALQARLATSGDGEASELVLIDCTTELGFPLHQAAAVGFFRDR